MEKIRKINIKLISYESDIGNSRLILKISGDNIDYIILNSIRRTIFSEIPIYAFNEFKFDKNTAIFHSNYLKLRFNNMPVWGIENNIDFIDHQKPDNDNNYKQDKNDNFDDIDYNIDKNINSSSLEQLTMYVTFKNKTKNIVTVTTNDAKFYYKEKQIDNPYKIPIPLVKLQGMQEISFSAITKIGIEDDENGTMYSAVSVAPYTKINDNEYDLTIESRGQITEKRIIQVALINIIRRLKNFINVLFDDKPILNNIMQNTKQEIETNSIEGVILINKEDHTLGNLISRGLQKHNKILSASYNLQHPLDTKVLFHYKLKEKGNIKLIMKDVVNYYTELFTNMKENILNNTDLAKI